MAKEGAGLSEPLEKFEGTPRQNAWAYAPARQRPLLGPLLCRPHSQPIGPADLLGNNPKHRFAPEGPIPRGLALQRRGLGIPEPQCGTPPIAPPAMEPLGAPLVIQPGEGAGPSKPWQHSKAQGAKMLVPTLPLASALTLARPSAHHTVGRSGLPAS